jgi:Ran GTPase-activating protein (RanGAP) involved in mRNA processing and transport
LKNRGIDQTGFLDQDKDKLQAAYDKEYQQQLEKARQQRRDNKRRAAQQAGLQKRRLQMEKSLQEEQDELANNHQLAMMIDMIKDGMVSGSLRLDCTSVSCRALAKALWGNTTITCLDLSSNNLNDHAGAYLARILKKNRTIKKLELDNNLLGPSSTLAFGNSLKVNTTLKYLSLDSNPISGTSATRDNSGTKALAEALRVNKTLTSLNLWRTGISAVAGNALASAIEHNDSLLFCDVGHNFIEIVDMKRITDRLDNNLKAFEQRERRRREEALGEDERLRRIREAEEVSHWVPLALGPVHCLTLLFARLQEKKRQEDLAKWLEETRDERAENRRQREVYFA